MSRATIAAALALAVMVPVSAQSSIDARTSASAPRAWSAVAGASTTSVIAMAADVAADGSAGAADPWCSTDREVSATLTHDFGETLIDDSRVAGADTQLWGSDVMGTWTLVLARPDATSCIVASGTGFTAAANPDVFYTQAGLAA